MYCMLFFFQDDEYRGKGTTGLPYFDCGRNNAVWLSMDMVVYPSTAGRRVPHAQNTGENRGQHKPSDDSTGKHSSGQYTTNKSSHLTSKAWNLIASSAEMVGIKEPQQQYPTSKLYKEGDRVVIYSMKTEQPIKATVRWTGQVQFSKGSAMPLAMVVGLETVSCMSVWYVCTSLCVYTCTSCVCVCLYAIFSTCTSHFSEGNSYPSDELIIHNQVQ